LVAASPLAAPPLPALGADLDRLTVSGISAGGYMAVQFQVAHSALVKGVGVLAGGPYECAEGSTWRALTNCMEPGSATAVPDAARTQGRIEAQARAGRIDPPAGLRDDRVWVLSGGADRTVERPVVDALVAFYRGRLADGALRYEQVPGAGHAMISIADPAANACATSDAPFINRCGEFDAAGQLLAHLLGPLGPLGPRSAVPTGEVLAYDQRPFTAGRPIDLSMAEQGHVYVPTGCRNGGCRVHVALHGCRQSETQIGHRFIDGAGYNEWADANRLIVLYPQATPRYGVAWGSWRWVYNPRGCWDWWGYTGPDYATRDAGQVRALRAMLARLADGVATAPPSAPER
jgi:poly(3-hydroxybutyrate) depolymerase